jgi:hypothetical protein
VGTFDKTTEIEQSSLDSRRNGFTSRRQRQMKQGDQSAVPETAAGTCFDAYARRVLERRASSRSRGKAKGASSQEGAAVATVKRLQNEKVVDHIARSPLS